MSAGLWLTNIFFSRAAEKGETILSVNGERRGPLLRCQSTPHSPGKRFTKGPYIRPARFIGK